MVAALRAEAVAAVRMAVADASEGRGNRAKKRVQRSRKRIAAGIKALDRARAAGDPPGGTLTLRDGGLAALARDIDGRCGKALDGKARFKRWGRHYLRALARAHQLQACTNFMDPGLQAYGGALFRSERRRGDAVFLSLPPPKPDVRGAASNASSSSAAAAAPNMTSYYAGSGGGCLGGGCWVSVARADAPAQSASARFPASAKPGKCPAAPGKRRHCPKPFPGPSRADRGFVRRRVRDVRAGDTVKCADGRTAVVQVAVRIDRPTTRGLVRIKGGPLVTGGHPVRVGGRWTRPRSLPGAKRMPSCDEGCVYNFVLDPRSAAKGSGRAQGATSAAPTLLVDGTACATWGHGELTAPVIGHAFFGSLARVSKQLGALPRDPATGHVRVVGFERDARRRIVGVIGEGEAS
jgi:hypothetical protein